VVPIPGVSAITTLLSVAGVRADNFWFVGFLPTKKGRQTKIRQIISHKETVVVLETGPRLTRFFQELIDNGGEERYLIIGRELTKQFEEIKAGRPAELLSKFSDQPPKGELTIVVSHL
jgi:16S rRNA (cytidine1402-2'-O)-methyltransferase